MSVLAADLLLVLALAVFGAVLYWPSADDGIDEAFDDVALEAEPVAAAGAD